jgi:hypothetical protein
MLEQLHAHEEALLPRGKQRALNEMRRVLLAYRKQASGDARRVSILKNLLELATGEHHGHAVDRAALADWWLRTIQPMKFRHLSERARTRPVLLRNLRRDLLRNPIETEQLEQVFDMPLFAQPIHERVVAAIVGVP